MKYFYVRQHGNSFIFDSFENEQELLRGINKHHDVKCTSLDEVDNVIVNSCDWTELSTDLHELAVIFNTFVEEEAENFEDASDEDKALYISEQKQNFVDFF